MRIAKENDAYNEKSQMGKEDTLSLTMSDEANLPPSLLLQYGLSTLAILLLTIVGLSSFTLPEASSSSADDPPAFDFYVMSMSFQPEFCFTKRKDQYPGCLAPPEFWKTSLTIHGLWPENADGSWPSSCSSEPLNREALAPILPELEHYWPNVKALQPTVEHFWDFWDHEWSKHGTCSGLNQLDYFVAAIHHFVPTPAIVGQHYYSGDAIHLDELRKAYGEEDGKNMVFACQGKRYLSEVRVCVKKRTNGIPTERIPCPSNVMVENSCEDEILIAKFPGPAEGYIA